MKLSIKQEKIAPRQLLTLLLLTGVGGVMGTDTLSFAALVAEALAAAALSLTVGLFLKKRPPSRGLKYLCSAGILALSALDFRRLYDLLTAEGGKQLPPFVILALLLIAAVYAYSCGLEAVTRTAPVLLTFAGLFLLTAMLCSVKSFHPAAPDFTLPSPQYFRSALEAPLLVILLYDSVNGEQGKTLLSGVLLSRFAAVILYLFCLFSLGKAARYSAFPVQALFELEGLGSTLNLDVLFTGAYLLALFFRTSVFLRAGVNRW